jgi:hypothetical protein
MSTEFFRKYMDIVDEAVRGVLVSPSTNSEPYAVRPSNQDERDQVARGLKTARAYNRDAAKYAAAPGEKQDVDPAELARRARGAQSGSIIQPGPNSSAEQDTGMPVNIPGHNEPWQTRAINTKTSTLNVGTDIKANQGKTSGPRKPVKPW